MLRRLATEDVPWERVDVLQVDERIAPAGSPERNWTHLRESLAAAPLLPERLHPMPVDAPDPERAAHDYARLLAHLAGEPPVLDVVHLGLGGDGHTASLVPGDDALGVREVDVTVTGPYQGRRRMTLTFPAIDRARAVLWVVTGGDKSKMLERLLRADRSIPAGRVRADRALALADRDAAGPLGGKR